MSDLNYSKKQLAPIIAKFGINTETNTLFHRVIEMFGAQPNYHIWAVKSIFSNAVSIETLEAIKAWADNNSKFIHMLSKNGNIVSYTTKGDFIQLLDEINGINRILLVKNVISNFNTDQRRMLESATDIANINSLTAMTSPNFVKWHDLLSGFSHLHKTKKNKVVRVLSAVRDMAQLEKLIKDSLKESYVWDKEDMLNFVANNCPNVDVVYNMGPIVILDIPSYKDSHAICYGRTQWCITRSSDYFRQYVTDHQGNRQFFFFDFSKKENHELAHVGFTVNPTRGITNAHSTGNHSMLGEGISIDGSRWGINRLLTDNHITMSSLMKLKKFNTPWALENVVALVNKTNGANIVLQKGTSLIVKVSSQNAMGTLAGFTLIPRDRISCDAQSQVFIVFNFGVDINNDKSLYILSYKKDPYGILSIHEVFSTYGSLIKDENPLNELGISTNEFLDRGKIDPSVLLHKYLDEKDEAAAIELIEKESERIDVNRKFNDRTPATTAIEKKMYSAFAKIVAHPGFNGDVDDMYGESLPQGILWSCYLDPGSKPTPEEDKMLRSMLITLINSGRFDLNYVDVNLDTLINIAASDASMNWLVEYLAVMPEVDPNKINDIDYTALGNALRHGNVEGVRILGQRPDLLIRDIDRQEAKNHGIDLNSLIKPISFEEMSAKLNVAEYSVDLAEAFAMAYSKKN